MNSSLASLVGLSLLMTGTSPALAARDRAPVGRSSEKLREIARVAAATHAGLAQSLTDLSDFKTEERNEHKNTLSFELLGRGGLYSLLYDRSISRPLALGVGISFAPNTQFNQATNPLVIPVFAHVYPWVGAHRLIVALGSDFVMGSGATNAGTGVLVPFLGIGYEMRKPSGFLLRIAPYIMATSHLVNFDDNGELKSESHVSLSPWIGVTVGGAF